jgi:hypothetical protein
MFKDVSVSLLNGPIVDGERIAGRAEGNRFAEYWPYGNDLRQQLDALE